MDNYVVLDLETTGLSKTRHKITEIAAARYCDGKIVDEFQSLVNPKVSIPGFITKLTGITNDMVKDAPTVDKVLPSFLEYLGDDPIVAHNASFDYGFIQHNAKKYGHEFCNDKICTRKLANRLLPELPSKKLSSICEHLNVKNVQAHRAMSDVHATVQVFSHFLDLMQEMNIVGKNKVMKFEKRPRK